MKLNASRTCACIVGRRKYRLRLTLRRVLTAMDVANDESVEDGDKVNAMLHLLVRWPRPIRQSTKVRLLNKILGILQGNEANSQGPEVLSLSQDAGLIRAAFLQAYHINLEDDDIHWERFVELLQAIPEGTALSRVLDLRSRPIPKATRFNKEERESLARAKRSVALKNEKQTPQQSADALASILIAIAKRG